MQVLRGLLTEAERRKQVTRFVLVVVRPGFELHVQGGWESRPGVAAPGARWPVAREEAAVWGPVARED